jgi:preprotein translocase subunit SecE|tara:strand:+ start:1244 stop:1489 length:246 start_codon:yes stop_codon:yes gene_type:complete
LAGSSSLSTRARREKEILIKIGSYIKESVDELLHKVSWPSWSDLQSSGIVVAIATVIISAIIYFMDTIFSGMMKVFYDFFG